MMTSPLYRCAKSSTSSVPASSRPRPRGLCPTEFLGEHLPDLGSTFRRNGKRMISGWRLLMKTRLLAVVISLLTASVLVAQIPQASSLGIESSKQQSVTVNGGNGPLFLRGAVELTVGSATTSADEVEIRNSPSEAVLRGTLFDLHVRRHLERSEVGCRPRALRSPRWAWRTARPSRAGSQSPSSADRLYTTVVVTSLRPAVTVTRVFRMRPLDGSTQNVAVRRRVARPFHGLYRTSAGPSPRTPAWPP